MLVNHVLCRSCNLFDRPSTYRPRYLCCVCVTMLSVSSSVFHVICVSIRQERVIVCPFCLCLSCLLCCYFVLLFCFYVVVFMLFFVPLCCFVLSCCIMLYLFCECFCCLSSISSPSIDCVIIHIALAMYIDNNRQDYLGCLVTLYLCLFNVKWN